MAAFGAAVRPVDVQNMADWLGVKDGVAATEVQLEFGFKCECGADTTYGADADWMHAAYCPKYKGKP